MTRLREPHMSQDIVQYILSRVKIETHSGCWEWVNYRNYGGYGRAWYHGKPVYAHRLAYTVFNGEINDGYLVCHQCDNPPCCNPAHLFLGTQSDNMRDCVRKNRFAVRRRTKTTRLTEKEVIEIRNKYASKRYTQKQLAEEYGVTRATISLTINRKKWKYL